MVRFHILIIIAQLINSTSYPGSSLFLPWAWRKELQSCTTIRTKLTKHGPFACILTLIYPVFLQWYSYTCWKNVMLTVYLLHPYFSYLASLIPLPWGNDFYGVLELARAMSSLFCVEKIIIACDIIWCLGKKVGSFLFSFNASLGKLRCVRSDWLSFSIIPNIWFILVNL